MIQLLIPLVIVAIIFAVREQTITARLRRELEVLTSHVVDGDTGLLSSGAVPLRLSPELEWAKNEEKGVGVVVYRAYGASVRTFGKALRTAMRGHEHAFILSENQVAVSLWDVDSVGARLALIRLGRHIRLAGASVVNAGFACFPQDGDSSESLIEQATRSWQPLDTFETMPQIDPRPRPGASVVQVGYSRFRIVAATQAWRWIAALVALVLFTMSFSLIGDPIHGLQRLLVVGAVALAIALGAVIAGRMMWVAAHGHNIPEGLLIEPTTWLATLIVAAVGVLASQYPELIGIVNTGSLLCAVFNVALVLVIVQFREFIRFDNWILFAICIGCAGLVFLSFESLPLVANSARIVGAAAIGTLISRNLEQFSWIVALSVLIAVIDIYSVFAENGVTNNLIENHTTTIDILLLQGPKIHDQVLFGMGTTDLIFLAVFLFTTISWRLNISVNMVAMWGALVASIVVSSHYSGVGIPVLPFMAAAFLLANAPMLRGVRSPITAR